MLGSEKKVEIKVNSIYTVYVESVREASDFIIIPASFSLLSPLASESDPDVIRNPK